MLRRHKVFLPGDPLLRMDPPLLATFLVVIAAEIIVPLLLGYLIVKRFSLPWKIFGLGALFFIVVQVVHTPLVLVIQQPLLGVLGNVFPEKAVGLAVFSLVLGFLAGIFEEPARYAVFRWIFPREEIPLRREQGLLFGAGWGGIECIFVAGILGLTLVSFILAPLVGQGGLLPSITPVELLPGLVERLMTIIHHIAWSLMVLASVVLGRVLFLVLAIAWHTALDAASVYLAATAGILPAEGVLFVSTVIAVLYLAWQWKRFGNGEKPGGDVSRL
jgi:uncharacterized membrane protein YhfC